MSALHPSVDREENGTDRAGRDRGERSPAKSIRRREPEGQRVLGEVERVLRESAGSADSRRTWIANCSAISELRRG